MAIITMAKLRAFMRELEKIPANRLDIKRWTAKAKRVVRDRPPIRRFWTPKYRYARRSK